MEYVLASVRLSEADVTKYGRLTEVLDRHFLPNRNIMYERARFNQRCQLEHERVEEFINGRIADTCDIGTLKGDHIRDRLVVGVRYETLSEIFLLDPDLTLDKAVGLTRSFEAVKAQQTFVRGNGTPGERPVEKRSANAVVTPRSTDQRGIWPQPNRRLARRNATIRVLRLQLDACQWIG